MSEIILKDFTEFVVKETAKDKKNLVMSRLARAYIEKCKRERQYVPELGTLCDYGTHIRVPLENACISAASINPDDRRIRYINPTDKFPKASERRRIDSLVSHVYEEAKKRKYRMQKGLHKKDW